MSEDPCACCPCCPCCEPWSREQERAATDNIKMNSKHRLVGRWVACPRTCYNRHTLQKIYITLAVALIILALVVLFYFCVFYTPTVYLEQFEMTECRVDDVEYNHTGTCTFTRDDETHYRHFTCLRVFVNYTLNNDSDTYHSLIYDDYGSLFNPMGRKCSYRPSDCRETGDMNREINAKIDYYSGEGRNASLACYYNPGVPSELVLENHIGVSGFDVRKVLGIMVCVTVSIIVTLLITYLICGCDFVCMSDVPDEIRDYVDTSHGEQLARHKTTLYTAGPIQIPTRAEAHELQPLGTDPLAWHRGAVPPPTAPPVPIIIPRDPSPPPAYEEKPGHSA